MKTKILIAAALVIGLISAAGTLPEKKVLLNQGPSLSKPDPIFNYVRSHRQGNGVTMVWSSSASSSVVSCFTIIRTYEDPTDPYAEWFPVNTVACNAARSYKSTDENVSPGFISYRVVASLVGGGYAYSDIETIHIVQH